MRLVYQRLLARIARRPEAVFGPRLVVSRLEKVACALLAWSRA
jgi:phytoene/squalene synthetase